MYKRIVQLYVFLCQLETANHLPRAVLYLSTLTNTLSVISIGVAYISSNPH